MSEVISAPNFRRFRVLGRKGGDGFDQMGLVSFKFDSNQQLLYFTVHNIRDMDSVSYYFIATGLPRSHVFLKSTESFSFTDGDENAFNNNSVRIHCKNLTKSVIVILTNPNDLCDYVVN